MQDVILHKDAARCGKIFVQSAENYFCAEWRILGKILVEFCVIFLLTNFVSCGIMVNSA